MTDPGSAAASPLETSLTDERILEHLKNQVAPELELRPEEIARLSLATPIAEGLQLDSLRQVLLLARLESDYGVTFSLDEIAVFEKIVTVNDLVRLVRERARVAPS
jgi:acyl carrier protein